MRNRYRMAGTMRTAKLVALLGCVASSVANGADFRPVTAQSIVANSPYSWYSPAVTVTAISGDGATIGGHVQDVGVDYDCTRNACGVVPFTWMYASASPSHFVNPLPIQFPTHQSETYPLFVTSLSSDGQSTLIVTEYGLYESAIYDGAVPQLLRGQVDPQQWLLGADMSASGDVVVGNLGVRPFHWDETSGLTEIENSTVNEALAATKVSGDGKVTVLNASMAFPTQFGLQKLDGPIGVEPPGNAYTWTEELGLRELPQLEGDDFSVANATSFNGGIVVGASKVRGTLLDLSRAVRWESGSPFELTDLTGFDWSTANDVTADGQMTVGRSFNAPALSLPSPVLFTPYTEEIEQLARAVAWNIEGEVFDLKTLLLNRHGLTADLNGWLLTNATLIADDGLTIAGRGISPEGVSEAWVLRLDRPLMAPEPSTGTLLLLALGLTYLRRTRAVT